MSAIHSIPEIDQRLIGLDMNPAVAFNIAIQQAAWWNALAASSSFAAAILAALSKFKNLK